MYSIVFTDISMPVMNGIQATKKIRGFIGYNSIKIVGVTGHVQESFKQEGIAAGMDEILEKPLYSEVLASILQKYNIL